VRTGGGGAVLGERESDDSTNGDGPHGSKGGKRCAARREVCRSRRKGAFKGLSVRLMNKSHAVGEKWGCLILNAGRRGQVVP